ncbi:hypothetical protein AD930_06465 [Acetobacter malorum]|nr:hypothetical protein AD930_06465 [Acetobacter malorum]
MPSISTITHFAQAHIPLPVIALYAILTSLESFVPPFVGALALVSVVVYQVLSIFKKTSHPPLPPIAFIRGCVSSFIGIYVVTLLILIPIRTSQLVHYLALPADGATQGSSLTMEGMKRLKDTLLSHAPDGSATQAPTTTHEPDTK